MIKNYKLPYIIVALVLSVALIVITIICAVRPDLGEVKGNVLPWYAWAYMVVAFATLVDMFAMLIRMHKDENKHVRKKRKRK